MSDRTVTAHHEASHAVAASLLRHRIDVVSIRPSDRHLGTVLSRPPSYKPSELGKLGAPIPLLSASSVDTSRRSASCSWQDGKASS